MNSNVLHNIRGSVYVTERIAIKSITDVYDTWAKKEFSTV